MELAICDFFDIYDHPLFNRDERLIRTYFCQLINGVKYLHSMSIYHLDLKFENILLGKDFRLKITDFDRAYIKGDKKMIGKGTECYRSPEIKSKSCQNFEAADIFSLGIILFGFLTGLMPYSSEEEDEEMLNILLENPEQFWQRYQQENDLSEDVVS